MKITGITTKPTKLPNSVTEYDVREQLVDLLRLSADPITSLTKRLCRKCELKLKLVGAFVDLPNSNNE